MVGTTEILPMPADYADLQPADSTELLSRAYELGELIKHSAFAAEYVYWKEHLVLNTEVHQLTKQFAKAKEKFAECERFGRFHPNYNEALDQVYEMEARLDKLEPVRKFKEAELALDSLLHEVSISIARSVSESIKVPDNDPNPKGSGCGNGGSCSCGSGGCG
jgi:cell fate (sporulation/competence/biofilm development) regulator YlbF (YheA/YmcA/DUF963 family)